MACCFRRAAGLAGGGALLGAGAGLHRAALADGGGDSQPYMAASVYRDKPFKDGGLRGKYADQPDRRHQLMPSLQELEEKERRKVWEGVEGLETHGGNLKDATTGRKTREALVRGYGARLMPSTQVIEVEEPEGKSTWAPTADPDAPPDPRLLNADAPEDRYAHIDFQQVPMRIIEAIRRKENQMSEDACRPHGEEFVGCMKKMISRKMEVCKPLLEEYQKCLRDWRESHPREYEELIRRMLSGELLERYRRRMRLVEEQWKKHFPDDPMPTGRTPSRRMDQAGKWKNRMDKDIIAKELAVHRLQEIDAMRAGMSVEEYRATTLPVHVRRSKGWIPAF